jgi:4-diphosphocytidyl-2-C-methyl-D-erythritol kinase
LDKIEPGPLLKARAPAKVNLTLHVLGRRADGYHQLESLVAFAGAADHLTLAPGQALSLSVEGTTAGQAGPTHNNLVVRAVRALQERRPGLKLGAFRLTKNLPAAAGIGGGSSDAAAALRLVAAANGIAADDPDLRAAAAATGADIPVCLEPQARIMRGAGEEVGARITLPPLFAILVNPRVAVPTADVFRALALEPGTSLERRPHPVVGVGSETHRLPALISLLARCRNDLEAPALALAPAIGEALTLLRQGPDCRLARMSGSGATVFGLYDDSRAAAAAARIVRAAHPGWWVKPTVLR